MKKLHYLTILACCWCVLPSHAQWTQNMTIFGGYVNSLFKTGEKIYASSAGGIFQSANEGADWAFTGTGPGDKLNGISTRKVFNSSTHLFAIVNETVKRSADQGNIWEKLGSGLDTIHVIDAATLSNTLLLFTETGKDILYKSTDNGSTFTQLKDFGLTSGLLNLYSLNNRVYIAGDSLFYTQDGNTVQPASMAGLPTPIVITGLTSNGTNLYAIIQDVQNETHVYQFNGVAWVLSETGLPAGGVFYKIFFANDELYSLAFDPNTEEIAIYRSGNDGLTWAKRNGTGLKYPSSNDLISIGNGKLLGAFADGVYQSSDSANSWTLKNNGLLTTSHVTLLAQDSVLITAENSLGILRSTDHGNTYQSAENGLPSTINGIFDLMQTPDAAYITLFGAGNMLSLYRTTDRAANWEQTSAPSTLFFRLIGHSGPTLFAIGLTPPPAPSFNYFRSTDQGETWENISAGFPTGIFVFNVAGDGSAVYYALENFIYRSTDNGNSWEEDITGMPTDFSPLLLTYTGAKMYFFMTDQSDGALKLYSRGDTAWDYVISPVGLTGEDESVFINAYLYNNVMYLVFQDEIYASSDKVNFNTFTEGCYSGMRYSSLCFLKNDVFTSSSGNGIWKNKALSGETSGMAYEENKLPTSLHLLPNPAGSEITINYQLKDEDITVLQLTDRRGQLLNQIRHDSQSPGDHSEILTTENLSAGIYLIRLTGKQFSETQKVVIIK